jgi:hypothetical protein
MNVRLIHSEFRTMSLTEIADIVAQCEDSGKVTIDGKTFLVQELNLNDMDCTITLIKVAEESN